MRVVLRLGSDPSGASVVVYVDGELFAKIHSGWTVSCGGIALYRGDRYSNTWSALCALWEDLMDLVRSRPVKDVVVYACDRAYLEWFVDACEWYKIDVVWDLR